MGQKRARGTEHSGATIETIIMTAIGMGILIGFAAWVFYAYPKF